MHNYIIGIADQDMDILGSVVYLVDLFAPLFLSLILELDLFFSYVSGQVV